MEAQIFLNGITVEQLAKALEPLLGVKTVTEPQQPENDFITRDAVCKLLSINKTTLWKHTKTGKLKSYGIGNRVMYKRTEVFEAVKPLKE
ncbi:helix-turn-helix domain-containing protein [Flavobacterium sp. FZUC8N2.13]|uniref:Helix-turn-helix domain-containing protein n=1 Tax=Flavobacterium zubiriense TaxID=3138075 RepID=A0ABV4TD65_9FLAO